MRLEIIISSALKLTNVRQKNSKPSSVPPTLLLDIVERYKKTNVHIKSIVFASNENFDSLEILAVFIDRNSNVDLQRKVSGNSNWHGYRVIHIDNISWSAAKIAKRIKSLERYIIP